MPPINLLNAPSMNDLDIPMYEPEGCEECGAEAGDFGDEDWDNGHYSCPYCGAVC